MKGIRQFVGNRGTNQKSDVEWVQNAINKCLHLLTPLRPLKADGLCGPVTIGAILEFQRRVMRLKNPDGRVDAGKGTMNKLLELSNSRANAAQVKPLPSNALTKAVTAMQTLLVATAAGSTNNGESTTVKTLTEADYKKAALILGVEVAAIKAVASVESKGGGFLSNGMPKILFEGHWFSKLTQGQFDNKYPRISYKTWTKKFYRGGASEYERYNSAKTLDKNAAMKATSWGMFQIMGFNHKQCGFDTVDAFVSAMHVSEGFQLAAFAKFIKSSKLDLHLKNKNWASFAKSYNGPGYAKNHYDTRMQDAYKVYSSAAGGGVN